MKITMPSRWLLGSVLFCALFAGRLRAADDGWSFELSPYLWVASAQVDSSLPNLPPSTPPDEPHFKSKITGALMVAGEVRRGSFGLFMDYDWLRLNTESTHPGPAFSAVNLRTDTTQFTAALTYRLATNADWQVELLAGARFWNVNGDVEFKPGILPGFTRSADYSWTDGNVGAAVSYTINESWYATGRVFAGGFGAGSTGMVDALGGVGYRFSPQGSVLLGFRYLREDFERDHFTWNLSATGVLLGFNFRF
jgi:hypothetical protein